MRSDALELFVFVGRDFQMEFLYADGRAWVLLTQPINSQTKRTKYEGAKVPLFVFLQCQKVYVHKAAVAAVSCMKMPLLYLGELGVTCSKSLSLWADFQGNSAVLCLTKVAVSSMPFSAISIGFLCKSVENGEVKTGPFLTSFSEIPSEIIRFGEKDVKTMPVLTSLFLVGESFIWPISLVSSPP